MLSFKLLAFSICEFTDEVSRISPFRPGLSYLCTDGPRRSSYLVDQRECLFPGKSHRHLINLLCQLFGFLIYNQITITFCIWKFTHRVPFQN